MRVPKAGSTSASVLARRLVGCYPRGPCCVNNGGNEVSCPSENAKCRAVAGCLDHNAPDKGLLQDPSVFSMANLRHIVDRFVSASLYKSSFNPPCTNKAREVNYFECFLQTVITTKFRNVASRMFAGRPAYASDTICMDIADSKECIDDLPSAIRGACKFNFITMCEAWSTSVLLLFETLPWIAPSEDFLPIPLSEDSGNASPVSLQIRKNTGQKHDEGIKHITQAMRELASEANAVDEELYRFVSAKFCAQLHEVGLLEHPLVMEELASFEPIYNMCNNSSWVATTLERFEPLISEDCRLYKPMDHPQGLGRALVTVEASTQP